jgi:hypothetical protein
MKNINSLSYIKRFESNLKEWNEENDREYTFEDVQDKFIDVRELKKLPEDNKLINGKCMCGHKISKEYEIINPENGDTLILGCDCIETYMIKSMSICEKCDKRFKFKPNCENRCNDCKKIEIDCDRCEKTFIIPKYRKKTFKNCKKCIEEIEEENKIIQKNFYIESCKCLGCGYIKKDNKYKYCYQCYSSGKNSATQQYRRRIFGFKK